jgi:hypothetical protein
VTPRNNPSVTPASRRLFKVDTRTQQVRDHPSLEVIGAAKSEISPCLCERSRRASLREDRSTSDVGMPNELENGIGSPQPLNSDMMLSRPPFADEESSSDDQNGENRQADGKGSFGGSVTRIGT